MTVENKDGCIVIKYDGDTLTSACEDLNVAKNCLVEKITTEFDSSVSESLGITYPYTVGVKTFYSKRELDLWILRHQ